MSITTRTHKMLWGRSGNRCAMNDCRIELVMDITETDDESLIGEECHIVARKSNGPRGDENFPEEKIDKYNNLLLLCRNHHKIIDDNEMTYGIEKLNNIKEEHESWVRNKLNTYDEEQQKDEETYATYIDKFTELTNLDNWKGWTSFVLGADDPRLAIEMYKKLEELREWLFSRIWSGRHKELEVAFENFRLVLQDFLNVFRRYSKKSSGWYYTEKFYSREWHDQQSVYDKLFKQYQFHVFLVEDLVIELTRAINYICQIIRKYIDYTFRLTDGIVIIEIGPFGMDFEYRQYRVKYSKNDLKERILYKNIELFKEERINRDYCRGVGVDENDARFIEFYNS